MNLEALLSNGLQDRSALLKMMATKLEAFFREDHGGFVRLMYRLDIPEDALQKAPNDFLQLAEVVLDRQLQKMESRKANPSKDSQDPELMW